MAYALIGGAVQPIMARLESSNGGQLRRDQYISPSFVYEVPGKEIERKVYRVSIT